MAKTQTFGKPGDEYIGVIFRVVLLRQILDGWKTLCRNFFDRNNTNDCIGLQTSAKTVFRHEEAKTSHSQLQTISSLDLCKRTEFQNTQVQEQVLKKCFKITKDEKFVKVCLHLTKF